MYQIIGLILLVTAIGAGSYAAVTSYNSAIEEAQVAKDQTRQAVEANVSLQVAAEKKRYDLAIERREREILQEKYDESRKSVQKLEGLFRDHDFENLYDKKPGLILKRVNAGTDRMFSDTASIINGTGGPDQD